MKISYKGKLERFYPAQQSKLDAKFDKLAKLLGHADLRVILSQERHLHHADMTVKHLERSLVGAASDPDQFLALMTAADKLSKQVFKVRQKRQVLNTKGGKVVAAAVEEETPAPRAGKAQPPVKAKGGASRGQAPTPGAKAKVYRVKVNGAQKPMTVDEARLALQHDPGESYLVYQNAGNDKVSVLVRRPDGHFDLIES